MYVCAVEALIVWHALASYGLHEKMTNFVWEITKFYLEFITLMDK